jgi:hypothetical protein
MIGVTHAIPVNAFVDGAEPGIGERPISWTYRLDSRSAFEEFCSETIWCAGWIEGLLFKE